VGTARRPGQSDPPDDPYAQTTPARAVFAVAPEEPVATAAYDGQSLRQAAESAASEDQTRSAQPRWAPAEPEAAHTAMMPGPRNVTRALAPVAPSSPQGPAPLLGANPARAGRGIPGTEVYVAVPTAQMDPVVYAAPAPSATTPGRSSSVLIVALVLMGVTLGVVMAAVLLVR